MITPVEYYQKAVQSGEIISDANQWLVVAKLQALYAELMAEERCSHRFSRFKNWLFPKPTIKSLYVWGSVGAGKTFLMNTFYHCLPFTQKKRWHFVEFMAEIHRQLQALKGEPNPLNKIAQRLAQLYRVICLDEFIVIEIVDAMILARLLTALMANRCVMVLTSNVVPDALYKNGLQREQFLPAIALINKHFEIIELSLNNDYRQRNANLTYFLFAQNGHELLEMEQYFLQYSAGSITTTDPMIIAGRSMPIKKRSQRVLWCDFHQLCHPPRSQFDYLEIVAQFDVIMLSHLPPILPDQHDIARLFIKLIDVIYDNQKRLIIASQVPIEAIYVNGLLSQEFQRTKSRLIELATAK